MSDEQRHADALDELTGDLRIAFEHLKNRPLPDGAIARAVDRAALSGSHIRLRDRFSWQIAGLSIAAAAAACVLIGLWIMRPTNSWADVVEAVQAKPWIHGVRREDKTGGPIDIWFSASGDKNASVNKWEITFFDHRLPVMFQYDLKSKVLYRLPAPKNIGSGFLDIFRQMFRGDAELHVTYSGMGLKDQHRTQIRKDGRDWDQFDLHFEDVSRANFMATLTLIVDPKTHLPHSLAIGLGNQGRPLNFEFDYPQTGPADIYALGVPKDARLVDCDPNGNLTRVLAGIQKSKSGFDDFHAIVVQNDSPDLLPGPGHKAPVVFLVWGKAERWRVEVIRSPAQFVPRTLPPKKEEPAWLGNACRKSQFNNLEVYDGRLEYEGNEFTQHIPQSTTAGFEALGAKPAEWAYPRDFLLPYGFYLVAIDPKPAEDPPNTVLLTWRFLGERPRDVMPYSFERFWIDPARSYAAVRHDILQDDPAVKPPTAKDRKILMDRWEKSPKGIWFPTRVCDGPYMKNGKWPKKWYHFYVDFPSDMPDSLFKPAKRTVLTDRYPVAP